MGLFRDDETSNSNGMNKVKNPKMVGGKPVGYLTTCSMAADLNSGLP